LASNQDLPRTVMRLDACLFPLFFISSYADCVNYSTAFATFIFGIGLNLTLPVKPGCLHRVRTAVQKTKAAA
jgi:hypothetical protein